MRCKIKPTAGVKDDNNINSYGSYFKSQNTENHRIQKIVTK
jgi:hypothetical protein